MRLQFDHLCKSDMTSLLAKDIQHDRGRVHVHRMWGTREKVVGAVSSSAPLCPHPHPQQPACWFLTCTEEDCESVTCVAAWVSSHFSTWGSAIDPPHPTWSARGRPAPRRPLLSHSKPPMRVEDVTRRDAYVPLPCTLSQTLKLTGKARDKDERGLLGHCALGCRRGHRHREHGRRRHGQCSRTEIGGFFYSLLALWICLCRLLGA